MGDGVSLTIKDAAVCTGVGIGVADGGEILDDAHVDIFVQHGIGIVLASVHEGREENQMACCGQVVEAILVNGQGDVAIVLLQLAYKCLGSFLVDGTFLERIPCLAGGSIYGTVFILAEQTGCQ